MAHTMKIIATPDKNDQSLKADIKKINDQFQSKGYKFIPDYSDSDDLVNKMRQLRNSDPDYPCVEELEIVAHGGVTSCDRIWIKNIVAFGQNLKSVVWCDAASIYLSGCNTGLAPYSSIPQANVDVRSLAERLADAMHFTQGSFEVHITVFGAVGYLWNMHMTGDARTKAAKSRWGYIPPYPESRTTTGSDCYIGFKNW